MSIAWGVACAECGRGVRLRLSTDGMGRVVERFEDGCIHEQRRRGLFTGEARAIRDDLVRVASEHGYAEGLAPPEPLYRKAGRFTCCRVKKIAGVRRWLAAVRHYGLTSPFEARTPTHEQVATEAARVMRACGIVHAMPTMQQWTDHGRYDPATVIRAVARGGGWGGVAMALGLKPAAPRYGKGRKRYTRESVLSDYRRLAAESGVQPGEPGPGRVAFEARYPYSYQVPKRMYGEWSAFVRAAGYEPQEKRGIRTRESTNGCRIAA